MDKVFKNTSQLGAFGEFVYKRFCEKQGHSVKRTNYCHTDFLVTHKTSGKQLYVDVKASYTAVDGYKGNRFGDSIVYETILVKDGKVSLIPSNASFLYCMGKQELGPLDELFADWKSQEQPKAKRKRILPDEDFTKLMALFGASQYPRVRIVERGDASSKRWTGTVDNLPGSISTQSKFDATVFVQYGCSDFQQHVTKILFIPHRFLLERRVDMSGPSDRQKNKGILEVINLQKYEIDFPEYVFEDLESLINFVTLQG